MDPLVLFAAASKIKALPDSWILGGIIGTTISVVVCTAIPITTGVAKHHVGVGIVGALFTLPAAAFLGCIGGLPVAGGFALLINLLPKSQGPLLSAQEIENEKRRMRGY